MTLPSVLFAVRWLVRDTLRQARASGVTAAMLVVTAVCTLLCLTVSVRGDRPTAPIEPGENRTFLPPSEAAKHSPKDLEGIDVPAGELTFLFGAFRVPLTRTRGEEVRFVEAVLSGGVADTAGVLLALVWTAGFLPTFLDPATASVLLAKPVPRWAVLVGKVAGVLVFVGGQALLFVAAVWAALGLRTGVWDGSVFAAVPLLLFHFGCFYAVSALLAVTTRSTVASVLGTAAVWFGCWWLNYARHAAVVEETAGPGFALLNAAYWALPKPADLGAILVDALQARDWFAPVPVLKAATDRGALVPELSLLTSCLLPVAAIGAATWRLARADY